MFNSVWFDSLIKPPLAPPSGIFSPVWSVLYMMIIGSFFVYFFTKTYDSKKMGYIYFAIQLLLNFLWSPIFFGMQNIGLALLVVILMDLFVFRQVYKLK